MAANIQFFPFSPGIPWKIKNNAITPAIDTDLKQDLLVDKELIVLGHGSLLEAFLSLGVLRAIKTLNPSHNVSWAGEKAFEKHCNATVIETSYLRERFPAPIFFDKKNNAYFNCLYNVGEYHTFLGKTYKNSSMITKQVFANSLCKWKDEYSPRIFNYEPKDNKLNKYVLLIIESGEKTRRSMNWGYNEVAALGGYLNGLGLQLVVVDPKPVHYFGKNIIKISGDVDKILRLIKDCEWLISNETDWLLIGMFISKCGFIEQYEKSVYGLKYNAMNLGYTIKHIVRRALTPLMVYEELMPRCLPSY